MEDDDGFIMRVFCIIEATYLTQCHIDLNFPNGILF